MTALYLFDTSAFIEGWHDHYPQVALAPVWDLISAQLSKGVILVPEQVKEELKRQDDEIWRWYSPHRHLALKPSQEVLDLAQSLMKQHPGWVHPHGKHFQNYADPFLVAWAKINHLDIVTYEKSAAIAQSKASLSLVCRKLGVQHFLVGEYLRREFR